ncbi:MAG: tetratricopeptide repeat protein [Candidatus Magnetoglobus multicellularis str. Araruama]|uniref:Tetratricopeptide repeat protein n=1 Tax=Candidatus Magnetoglobus multicellularis str. Araruama TaxID=890399 RepID=A0A1V1PG44_9BACT|nr:MAG: tetratricopeptide repeat protein [Candidatus Magnetoglobus multicellularis str. Araruama]
MSYIHEALVKAQKERNGHYSTDPVQVAESIGLTTRTSWWILTLLLMLISIFVAIIVVSWFKTIQKEKLHGVSQVDQAEPVTVKPVQPVVQPEQKQTPVLVKQTHKNVQKQKQNIPVNQDMMVSANNDTHNEKNVLPIAKQTQDDYHHALGPNEFLEVSRLYEKGLQKQVEKKYDSAIAYYKKCLDISPHMAPALNNMGVILLKKREYQSAKQYFFTAIKESPDYVDPYYNLACLFSQINDTHQAIEYLKKAVRIAEEARNWAITDRDFAPLYELKEFNMIISGY